MTNLICPVCSSHLDENLFKRICQSPFNNKEYKLYHCLNCDLEFWNPLVIDKKIYEDEKCTSYEDFHSGTRELPLWCLSFFKEFPQNKGKILDVGCGDGIFLDYAKKNGFEVYGVDFDSKSIEIAKNKYGLLNTYCMSLDEVINFAKEEKIFFDFITFFEVIEHSTSLKDFFKFKEILNDGGYIVGTTPNRQRLLSNLDRKLKNNDDYPPHHFLWFSKKSIENLFVRNGFKEIKTYITFFGVELDNKKLFLKNLDVIDNFKIKNKKINVIFKFFKIAIFLLPTYFFNSILKNKGGGIYFEAKK